MNQTQRLTCNAFTAISLALKTILHDNQELTRSRVLYFAYQFGDRLTARKIIREVLDIIDLEALQKLTEE